MTILLTQDQQSTIRTTCDLLVAQNGDRYYHMPYFLKEGVNGMFERLNFDALPESVKEQLLTAKGIKL